jgi:hypothetical protein
VHPLHQVAVRVHLARRLLLLEVAQQLQAVHCGSTWRHRGVVSAAAGRTHSSISGSEAAWGQRRMQSPAGLPASTS